MKNSFDKMGHIILIVMLTSLSVIYSLENIFIWGVLDLPDDSTFFIETSKNSNLEYIFEFHKNYFLFFLILKFLGGNVFLVRILNIIVVLIILGILQKILFESTREISDVQGFKSSRKFRSFFVLNFILFYSILPVWRDIYILFFLVLQYYFIFIFHKCSTMVKKIYYLSLFIFTVLITYYLSSVLFAISLLTLTIIFLISNFKLLFSRKINIYYNFFFLAIFFVLIYNLEYIKDKFIYLFVNKGFLIEARTLGMEEKIVESPILILVKSITAPGIFFFFDKSRLYYRYTLDLILFIGMVFYYYFFVFKMPYVIFNLKKLFKKEMIPHLYFFLCALLYLLTYAFGYGGSIHIRKKMIFFTSFIYIFFILRFQYPQALNIQKYIYFIFSFIIFIIIITANLYQLLFVISL